MASSKSKPKAHATPAAKPAAKPATSSADTCPRCPAMGWPANAMEPHAGVLRCVRCGHTQVA